MRTRSPALAPMQCIAFAFLLILLLVTGTTCATDAESEEEVCTAANADSAECTGNLPPMKGVAADEGNADGCTDDHVKCAEWADLGECVANPKYMLVSCRKACGICGDTQDADDDELCEDNDPKNCPLWATDTEFCSIENDRADITNDLDQLLTTCRKSCGCCVTKTSDFGVEQELTESDEKYDATRVIIRESIKYMKEIRNSEDTANIRMCQNKDKLCSYWAAIGECKANKPFMNSDCAPACHTCYLIDLKQRCPIDPDAKGIIGPGDLNKLFERATTKEEYVLSYNPTILSRPNPSDSDMAEKGIQKGPWVVTFDNFLNDKEVEALLKHGNENGYKRSSDVGKAMADGSHGQLVSKSRTSENSWCGEKCKADPLVAAVNQRIAEVTSTTLANAEDLQLLRYEPGQYYVQHHDYIDHQLERPCGVRILTFFLYLNDVCDEEDKGECGGGTAFPELNITVQPKKGSALLWPSVLDDKPNEKDERTDHEALVVKKGIKYGANAW